MYVSVNSKNEIKEVGITTNPELTSLFIKDTDDNPFKDWSESKICCYKVNVVDGYVSMLTPYVDSRLIEHFDRLGENAEQTDGQVTDLQMAMVDVYEITDAQNTINQQQITDLELAVVDLYEMIGG